MGLHLNTVSDLLWEYMKELMLQDEFNSFRLVGGTSLSLQLGHRESVDIDLFTDAQYGSVDFARIELLLTEIFPYVDSIKSDTLGFGKSFFIGKNEKELVKLDLFYTDDFVFPLLEIEGVRFARIEEIAAMKLDVISRGGRKKDFWDIHELLDQFAIEEMLGFYSKRYPYGIESKEIIDGLLNFDVAEYDFTPICYREKVWEIIKLDIEDLVNEIRKR